MIRDLLGRIADRLGYVPAAMYDRITDAMQRRIVELGDEITAKDREIGYLNAEYGSILRQYAQLKIAVQDFRASLAKTGL